LASLAKHGLSAKGALLGALKHRDPEVRLRARRLLGDILDADYLARLQAFIEDAEGKHEHDLPGWERFRRDVGEDKAGRELFAAMHKAEPALMESAGGGGDVAAEILLLRCFQMFRGVQVNGGATPRQFTFPGVAALVFVAGDEQTTMPDSTLMQVYNVLQQAAFQQAMQSGPHTEHARRLLAGWIRRSTGTAIAQQSIYLAMQWNLKEGLLPARKLVGDKSASAYVRANAVMALGKLGGQEELSLLQSLLKDTAVCASRTTTGADGKTVDSSTQIRDLALAVLIHFVGQSHKDYGLNNVQPNQHTLFSYHSIYFANPAARDAALQKWEDWAAKNTLEVRAKPPEAKKPAPTSTSSVIRGGIFFAPAVAPMLVGADPSAAEKTLPADDLDFYVVDRETAVRLLRARQLIEQRQYANALRFVDDVLAQKEARAYQTELSRPIFQSLRGEAERILGMLPDEGRRAYEMLFGADARRALDDAVDSGDAQRLAVVAGRYLFTQAGQEAALLWGSHLLDVGQPLAAASVLGRLQEVDRGGRFEPHLSMRLAASWLSGAMPQEARDVLSRLGRRRPRVNLEFDGRTLPSLANLDSLLTTLRGIAGPASTAHEVEPGSWTMARGNAQRNSAQYHVQSDADDPLLRSRWHVDIARQPAAKAAVDSLVNAYRQERVGALPAGQPIAAGGIVLLRTSSELQAIDLASGSLQWRAAQPDSVDDLLNSPGGDKFATANELYRGLDDRLFGDATYGTLSSDGGRVFLIEDLGFAYGAVPERMVVRPDGSRRLDAAWPREYNRLAAYDIRTGKLKWELGGPRGPLELDAAGVFFLGPPLPLSGRLYVMGELDQRIHLFTLQTDTGRVLERQHLATIERADTRQTVQIYGYNQLPERIARRMCGASPSYGGGVLVCPTTGESYVAVDMATRQILWSYRPLRSELEGGRMMAVAGLAAAKTATNHPIERDLRWADGHPVVAGQSVLLTPRESDRLFCLELRSGRLRWEAPRMDAQFVACVHGEIVLLVGGGTLRGLRMADGQQAYTWKLPAGAVPSGRGYLASGKYYLPLTSAEVAVVDAATGRLLQRSRSRDGRVPGNLICYRDQVISQAADGIDAFERLETALSQTTANMRERPNDAGLLAEHGEILAFSGRFTEAISQLRRSLSLRADDRTRALLCDAVLQALQADFASYHDTATELSPFFAEAGNESTYLRTMAEGLRKTGQTTAAFAALLRLAELGPKNGELETIESALSTRRDLWLQGQLAEIRAAATPAQRAEFDRLIADQFAKAAASKEAETLRDFLQNHGAHPLADRARDELLSLLLDRSTGKVKDSKLRPLYAEQLLLQLERTGDVAASRSATARLARLMAAHGRPEEAAAFYRRLGGDLADAVCLEGKTGRQLLADLPSASTVHKALDPSDPWPQGVVDKQTNTQRVNYTQRRWPLLFDNVRNNLLSGLELEVTTGAVPQKIIARDVAANERWSVELRIDGLPAASLSPQLMRARADGHLLVVWQGNRVFAIDTLSSDASRPGVIWSKDLTAKFPGFADAANVTQSVMVLGGAMPVFRALDAYGRPQAELGPVTGRMVCYQRLRQLVAVDPYSGETLWSRSDVPRGSELWGDDEVVLVTPPESNEARVLRAADGQEIGRCEVPPSRDRIATLERFVVTWISRDDQSVLAVVDPWHGKEKWRREFAAGAKITRIGQDELGVLDPQGRFVILELPGGKNVLEAQLEPQRELLDIVALRSRDGYVLVAKQPVPAPAAGTEPETIYPISMGGRAELITGKLYGFDGRGKLSWSRSVVQHGLDLSQNPNVPILVFAHRSYSRRGGPARYAGTILALDKRDGRVVHEETLDQSIGQVQVVADAATHSVEIRTTRAGTKLNFTGKPLAAK
jgi:outer membrane protein assembly factor BamB